jgi:hypothetical protein
MEEKFKKPAVEEHKDEEEDGREGRRGKTDSDGDPTETSSAQEIMRDHGRPSSGLC